MLSSLYEQAQSQNCDICVCDYYEVYDNNKVYTKAINKVSDNNKINYMLSNPSPWNKLIKAKLFKENNIKFLENYIYEDLATMPILAGYANDIAYLEKPLYNYIIRNGSTMRQTTYNKKLDSIFVAVSHLENEFKIRNLYSNYKDELEYICIEHLLYASSGRFLYFEEGKSKIKEIIKIIKEKYPYWKQNKYYKKQSITFKITCDIFYSNNQLLINLYNKTRKILKES